MALRFFSAGLLSLFALGGQALAAPVPGVTDTEITIGVTGPLSGPAAAWGTIALASEAYATYVNQQYAIRNPKGFRDYGQYTWGITASNGPGPTTRRVRGVTRRFLGCSHPLSGSRPGSPREFHVPAMKGFNHAGLRLQLSQW